MKPLRISDSALLNVEEQGADGLRISARLKDFTHANLNGERYRPDSYDSFIEDYYCEGGFNVPLCLNHDATQIVGKVTLMDRDESGMTIAATIYKDLPRYEEVCALIRHGLLQGVSDGGAATDYEPLKDAAGVLIKKACVYEISLVSTPAEIAAGLHIENTTFRGFGADGHADAQAVDGEQSIGNSINSEGDGKRLPFIKSNQKQGRCDKD